MIDDTIGKILGMAMAYGVSSLGLFLAYVNYRKRTVKADKIMTGTAWAVLAVVLLGVAGGVLVVAQLAEPPADESMKAPEAVVETPPPATASTVSEVTLEEGERDAWPLIGILLPAGIFLFATWVTTALHRRFAMQHPQPVLRNDPRSKSRNASSSGTSDVTEKTSAP
jgi:hypothetical protein